MDHGVGIQQPFPGGYQGVADGVQAFQQDFRLPFGLLLGPAVHLQPGDLHHQHRADQQRDQGCQQHGAKQASAEGGSLHFAASCIPSFHRARMSSRFSAAQAAS